MRGAILYGQRDVRFEDRPEPTIIEPTDAIIRMAATCVCGSDCGRIADFSRSTATRGHGRSEIGNTRRFSP